MMVEIDYTNWRGERRVRCIKPLGAMRYGTTSWHPQPQWLLSALDVEDGVEKDFACSHIHAWKELPCEAG